MRVFAFSNETIKREKKHVLIIQLLIPIVIFASVFIGMAEDEDTSAKIWIFLVSLILMESILIFLWSITLKKWRNLKITISDDTIESKKGKSSKSICLRDVTCISVRENKLGNIISIYLNSFSQQMLISGFEDMDFLFNEIVRSIPDKANIQRRTESIDWQSPLSVLLIAVPITFAIIALLIYAEKLFGENALFILIGFYILLRGIFGFISILISKSISTRSGTSEMIWKVVYIIAGALIIVGAMKLQW